MKTLSIASLALVASLTLGPSLSAVEDKDNPQQALKPRIRVGVSALHGIQADFKNLGTSGFINNPGPDTGAGEERFYDDGFNRVDISGNAGDVTSYWSYNDASQYDSGNDVITMSSVDSTDSSSTSDEESLVPGIEIALDYPIGRAIDFEKIDEWGLSIAFQWHRIDIENSSTLGGNTILIEDSFSTSGSIPPGAPYTGSFTGPGFLLDSTPERQITNLTGGGTVTGSRSVDANLFSLNLGPYARVHLSDRASLNLSAGAVLSLIQSEYKVDSAVAIGGSATGSKSGRDNKSSFLAGAYARAGLEYAVTDSSFLSFDLGYRVSEDFDQQAAGSTAELDFGSVLSLSFAYSFEF